MKKVTVLLLVAVLLLSVSLTGCAKPAEPMAEKKEEVSEESAPAEEAKELQTLNVAHMPYIHSLPTYHGVKSGYIKDTYGLDVNLLMFTSGPAVNEALGANEWDIAVYGAPPGIMGGIAHNSKLIAFSVNDTATQEIWVRPDNPIAQISGQVDGYPEVLGDAETWKGQTVLIPTSTTLYYILLATLEKLNLTVDQLEVVHMETAQAFTAFKAGQGDMVGSWEPFTFAAVDEGWVKVSSGPGIDEFAPVVIIASEKALAEKPEEIKLWLQSYYDFTDKFGGDDQAVVKSAARILSTDI